MSRWKSFLKDDTLDWLLEESNPSVRYFTLRWMLNKTGNDPEVVAASKAISQSTPIVKILKQQRPEGYWGSDPRPHHGTKGQLMLLMWLRYRGNGGVQKAMEYRIEGCLQEDGGYGYHIKGRTVYLPCYGAELLRLMILYGYKDDPRTKQLLEWLVSIQAQDGMWPCISKKKPFPCMWATAVVLRAYRQLPSQMLTPQVEKSRQCAVEFFLNANLFHQQLGKQSPRWFQFGFPLQWDTDTLEVLDLVAPYVDPEDERIQEGLDLVLEKQDQKGRWPCEKHPKGGRWIKKYLPLEEIGQPSKWVTLHALKMLKTLYSGGSEDHLEEKTKGV